MSVILFLSLQSRPCRTEQCHIFALLGIRETLPVSPSVFPLDLLHAPLSWLLIYWGRHISFVTANTTSSSRTLAYLAIIPLIFSVNTLRKLSSSSNFFAYI